MYSMKLIEPIAKMICKIMNLSLHFCELSLPKEQFPQKHSTITSLSRIE